MGEKIKWIFRNDPVPNQWQLYVDTLGEFNPRYYRVLERTPTLHFLATQKKISSQRIKRQITYEQVGSTLPMGEFHGGLPQERYNDHIHSYDPRRMEATVHRCRNMVSSGRRIPHQSNRRTELYMRSHEDSLPGTQPPPRSYNTRHKRMDTNDHF